MITFKRITTADTALYSYMEQLMTASFPAEEYRTLEELRRYTDKKPQFHNNVILKEENPIGLFTYWDFDTFYYAEHFAIDPTLRNGGYGKAALEHLTQKLQKPIILEVESPEWEEEKTEEGGNAEMARRRIRFYQRHGFTLWQNPYLQPPYKPGDSCLPMLLMAYGNLNPEEDFETVKSAIYKEVYNYTASL